MVVVVGILVYRNKRKLKEAAALNIMKDQEFNTKLAEKEAETRMRLEHGRILAREEAERKQQELVAKLIADAEAKNSEVQNANTRMAESAAQLEEAKTQADTASASVIEHVSAARTYIETRIAALRKAHPTGTLYSSELQEIIDSADAPDYIKQLRSSTDGQILLQSMVKEEYGGMKYNTAIGVGKFANTLIVDGLDTAFNIGVGATSVVAKVGVAGAKSTVSGIRNAWGTFWASL
jgi:hypothetical protein